MSKCSNLHIRLSLSDLSLIKNTASKFDMTLTDFISSVLIQYCVKVAK